MGKVYQTWTLNPLTEPKPHRSATAIFHSLSPTSPDWDKLYMQVHTPSEFTSAPSRAVETLLSLPNLNLEEDKVLQSLLTYVCKPLGIPPSPKLWIEQGNKTKKKYTKAKRLISEKYIKYIKPLSLSSMAFIDDYLPFLVDTEKQEDIQYMKFKYDSLKRYENRNSIMSYQKHPQTNSGEQQQKQEQKLQQQPLTYDLIKQYFKQSFNNFHFHVFLRGQPIVKETPHPCVPSQSSVAWDIFICPINDFRVWSNRLLLEFDKRTEIVTNVFMTLSQYKPHIEDKGAGTSPEQGFVMKCDDIWQFQRSSNETKKTIKSLIWDYPTLYINVWVKKGAPPFFGWKVLATPIVT